MKYLKRFNENQSSDIEIICNQYGIEDYRINPDGTVDVDGNVYLSEKNLTKLPIKFGKVTGKFSCSNNQLRTLEGAPKVVGGDFYCSHNQLTSLEGVPIEVGGDFYCHSNGLTSLEGAPQNVGGDFDCCHNQLRTLEGAPQNVGDFYCNHNQLTTLEGAPNKIGGNFYCHSNRLTSLEGSPKEVGGKFSCSNNQLRTLEGAPNKIGGDFYCDNNPIYIIYQLFEENFLKFLDKINFIYTDLFNGSDMLRGDVLEQIAEELEIELPVDWVEKLEKKGYQII